MLASVIGDDAEHLVWQYCHHAYIWDVRESFGPKEIWKSLPGNLGKMEINPNYPILGEKLVMNFRTANLDSRCRAMLEFAEKVTIESHKIDETDRQNLRDVGFNDADIWDITNIIAFFNMSNRVASALNMKPNDDYHSKDR